MDPKKQLKRKYFDELGESTPEKLSSFTSTNNNITMNNANINATTITTNNNIKRKSENLDDDSDDQSSSIKRKSTKKLRDDASSDFFSEFKQSFANSNVAIKKVDEAHNRNFNAAAPDTISNKAAKMMVFGAVLNIIYI
jgi:hypothetical protein